MKFGLQILGLLTMSATIAGSVYGSVVLTNKDNPRGLNGLGIKSNDSYFLVEKSEFQNPETTTPNKDSEDYQCFLNKQSSDCELFSINFDNNKKALISDTIKNLPTTKQSYSELKSSNKKHYLLKTPKQTPISTSKFDVVSDSSKINFSILGSFNSEGKFLGNGTWVIAKLSNVNPTNGFIENSSKVHELSIETNTKINFSSWWVSKGSEETQKSLNSMDFSDSKFYNNFSALTKFNFSNGGEEQLFIFSLLPSKDSETTMQNTNLLNKTIHITEKDTSNPAKTKTTSFEIQSLLIWDRLNKNPEGVIVIK